MITIFYILKNRMDIKHCTNIEIAKIIKNCLIRQGASILKIANECGESITIT